MSQTEKDLVGWTLDYRSSEKRRGRTDPTLIPIGCWFYTVVTVAVGLPLSSLVTNL